MFTLEEKSKALYDARQMKLLLSPETGERGVFFVITEDAEMQKVPMTKKGAERLQQELTNLKSVERPAIIAAIAEAREHGDLSENAEYHAAREKQSFIEGRIQELESAMSCADIIDTAALSGDTVVFGATVSLMDEDTEDELKYQIVGQYEADLEHGRISVSAPLARALIGKAVGDTAELASPKGKKSYEILEIEYV